MASSPGNKSLINSVIKIETLSLKSVLNELTAFYQLEIFCIPYNTKLYFFLILYSTQYKIVLFSNFVFQTIQNYTFFYFCIPSNTKNIISKKLKILLFNFIFLFGFLTFIIFSNNFFNFFFSNCFFFI